MRSSHLPRSSSPTRQASAYARRVDSGHLFRLIGLEPGYVETRVIESSGADGSLTRCCRWRTRVVPVCPADRSRLVWLSRIK